jgi:hypothetical protein
MLRVSKSGIIEAQQNSLKDNPRNVNLSLLITIEPSRYSGIRLVDLSGADRAVCALTDPI